MSLDAATTRHDFPLKPQIDDPKAVGAQFTWTGGRRGGLGESANLSMICANADCASGATQASPLLPLDPLVPVAGSPPRVEGTACAADGCVPPCACMPSSRRTQEGDCWRGGAGNTGAPLSGASPARLSRPGLGFAPGDALSIPGEEDGDALSILGEEELGCRTWTVDCAYRGTCCCCSPSGMNCG